ncbi:protein sel-1 homolog 3 isoform X1 [Entelurus aequoreus]|uniref:protein sel-1 homolog 3 isoform X1 n=1 Tax=Entelurus aequoreus TaxID=161455 RepID=UPI002B1D8B34|nr:protein sel-1 homolog 3 isoform X1 [Entelurus aequoreus]
MHLQVLAQCAGASTWQYVAFALDSVRLLNPPEEPLPDHPRLEVFYSCDAPATVQLDCVVTFDVGDISTSLLRQWGCVPGKPKKRTLRLTLPDWLVYQPDEIVAGSRWALSCILRASVRYERVGERAVAAQDVATLQPRPPYSRPVKQHQVCFAWGSLMLRFSRDITKKQCPREEETVHFLSSIFASTGEVFGITKILRPYGSDVLEYLRARSFSSPWCVFSMWVFVARGCQDSACGLLHHIDSLNDYATPTLLLTKSGHLHIQLHGSSNASTAILSHFEVPLREWCQLSVKLQGKTVTVTMVRLGEESRAVESTKNRLSHDITLIDTDGYFVIGGGRYIKGVEGYFGPLVYYRNRASTQRPSEVVIPDVIKDVNLTGWLQTCQEVSHNIRQSIDFYSLLAQQGDKSGIEVFSNGTRKDSLKKCELWEAAGHRFGARVAKYLALKHGGRGLSLQVVGRALYSLARHKLNRASNMKVLCKILPLLLQAGCLGDTRALHMSAVVYSAGLGVEKEPSKAWLLALLAAQKDNRFALLHLGHLHHHGQHGVLADPDVAYAYYANIAQQTTLDRLNPSPEQVYVEEIYLHNEEVLQLQTNENHHIFQWLKHQAHRGAPDAEQAVARMLFWGQQGVSPNIQAALRHYERGAVLLEDPASMYDFGITLLQGHGVQKDIPKAIMFLKKAMDKGFVPAISALAWYYEQSEGDYNKAVQLWEKADLLGSPDAALNLGVVYSLGLYPQQAADQYMAYKYYLKAAERGHIRGAAEVANIWSTGIPGHVTRRPSDAVLWAKWAAEQNGHLGRLLRRALDCFLKSDMFGSLVYYITAAELGYTAAQFNVAYLCDQNKGDFLDPAFALNCMQIFYNLTIQNPKHEPYALIRMGDMWYEGQVDGRKRLYSAAEMYKRAALKNEPQGWYNLGLLVEEDYRLPLPLLSELGLLEFYFSDKTSLRSVLYQRCRDSENSDSYLPCSLALFKLHLQVFQKEYSTIIKYATTITAVGAPTIVVIILGLIRRRVLPPN